MKAFPKYNLTYHVVTFTSEDGREFTRPMSDHEVAILRGYYNNVPGIHKFMDQLTKPIEMVKKSCVLDVKTHKHHLKTMNVTTEEAEEYREYWDIPWIDRPKKVPVDRVLVVND